MGKGGGLWLEKKGSALCVGKWGLWMVKMWRVMGGKRGEIKGRKRGKWAGLWVDK